ncbi:MAG TPA: lysophospholipid acyltransferase family protein [Geothrix sp.]|nr:lysophospholipid acyltransferase family protein [Geothrix sp.]
MIYWIAHTLSRLVGYLFFRHRTLHREFLPESGGAMIVANHVSYLDPAAIGAAFRKPIYYLARKTLFKGFLGWLLPRIQVLPVDLGKGDLASMKRILGLLKQGERVLLFPEGTRSPDGTLQEAEAGIGFIIAKAEVPVVPVRIFGAFECWERGAKWPHPGRITIVAGPPVDVSSLPAELSGRERYQACADLVMQALAAIQPEG